jgi:hypothetical protein
MPAKRDDVARLRLVDILQGQAAEGLDLRHAELFDLLADAAERLHRRPDLEPPDSTRPVRMRPTKGSAPSVVASMRKSSSSMRDLLGGGHVVHDQIKQRVRSLRGPSSS